MKKLFKHLVDISIRFCYLNQVVFMVQEEVIIINSIQIK